MSVVEWYIMQHGESILRTRTYGATGAPDAIEHF